VNDDLGHLLLGFVKIVPVGDGLRVIFFLLTCSHCYQKQDGEEYYSLKTHGNVKWG
jgi:hypothetical protein